MLPAQRGGRAHSSGWYHQPTKEGVQASDATAGRYQQAAELRLAFLRTCPSAWRCCASAGQRLCDQGWDINALTLLFRRSAAAGRRLRSLRIAGHRRHLFSIERFLAPFVDRSAFPMPGKRQSPSARCAHGTADRASASAPRVRRRRTRCAAAAALAAADRGSPSIFPSGVTPPPDYWHRFVRHAHPPRRGNWFRLLWRPNPEDRLGFTSPPAVPAASPPSAEASAAAVSSPGRASGARRSRRQRHHDQQPARVKTPLAPNRSTISSPRRR